MAEFVIRGAGQVIRQTREARGLSLAQLAETMGCDKSQLAKYETNKVGISDVRLARLAAALNVPAAALAHECLLAIKPHLKSKPIGQLLGQISRPQARKRRTRQ